MSEFRIHFTVTYDFRPWFSFVEHIPTGKTYKGFNIYEGWNQVKTEHYKKKLTEFLHNLKDCKTWTTPWEYSGFVSQILSPEESAKIKEKNETYKKKEKELRAQKRRAETLADYATGRYHLDGKYARNGNNVNEDDKRMAEKSMQIYQKMKEDFSSWAKNEVEETVKVIEAEIAKLPEIDEQEYLKEKELLDKMVSISRTMFEKYNAGPSYWEDSPAEISVLSQVDWSQR